VPANASGVIDGIIASSSGCIPSLRDDAEITTSRRTTSGWRMPTCSATPPPMLKPTTSARATSRWPSSAATSSAIPS
jgi:hypothetical protein